MGLPSPTSIWYRPRSQFILMRAPEVNPSPILLENGALKLKNCAIYFPDHSFEYLTPRIRITPNDLPSVNISKPTTLHFICSPSRAAEIVKEVKEVEGWSPITIYEPIPVIHFPLPEPAAVHLTTSRRIAASPKNSQHLGASYPLSRYSGKWNQPTGFPSEDRLTSPQPQRRGSVKSLELAPPAIACHYRGGCRSLPRFRSG